MNLRPMPVPTVETRPFWDGLQRRLLVLPKCSRCLTVSYPPRPRCPRCLGADLNWTVLPPRGRLHSWTEVHTDLLPSIAAPFVIVEAEIGNQPGLVLIGLLVGMKAEALWIGMPIELSFASTADGFILPQFESPGQPGAAA